MGRDVVTDAIVLATVDAPVVIAAADALDGLDLAGKALVVPLRAAADAGAAAEPVQPERGIGAAHLAARTSSGPSRRRIRRPSSRSSPTSQQDQWDRTTYTFPRGTYGARSRRHGRAARADARRAAALRARVGARRAARSRRATRRVDLHRQFSVSVRQHHRARCPAATPRSSGEYVLFSAHQDHDGVRYAVNGDDIWNGADDNASTAVALLAIGRAVVASPGRRSSLFIWHGSEERGLMGSRWYVEASDRAARRRSPRV